MFLVNFKKYLPSTISAHSIFASVALIFGFTFIAITPPLWGIDEVPHFARSYQISTGGFLPHQNIDKGYGGALPVNLIALNNYVYGDLMNNKATGSIFGRKDVDSENTYREMMSVEFSSEKEEYSFPGAAAYSPIAYIPPAIGILMVGIFNGTISDSILFARLFSLLSYIGIVVAAIWLLRGSRLKWVVFLVALMPMSLFQASIVNADSMIIGLSLVFMALFINLLSSKSDAPNLKAKAALLIVVGTLLPLVKVNYIFLSAALMLLPSRLFNTKKNELIYKFIGLGIVGLFTLLWLVVVRNVSSSIGNLRPDGAVVDVKDQLIHVLGNPFEFIEVVARTLITYGDVYPQQITGILGWNIIAIPLTASILLIFAIFLAVIYALREFTNYRGKLLLVGVFSTVGVVGIFGALYLTFTPVSKNLVDGIQGRYFIPFLMPLVLGLFAYMPIKVDMSNRLAMVLFSLISLLVLTTAAVYYFLATH